MPLDLPHVKRGFKTVLDSRFHAVDSGFQVLNSGTWIPGSNRSWDSGSHELHSGLQSPGLRIPQRKIYQIP